MIRLGVTTSVLSASLVGLFAFAGCSGSSDSPAAGGAPGATATTASATTASVTTASATMASTGTSGTGMGGAGATGTGGSGGQGTGGGPDDCTAHPDVDFCADFSA